MTAVSPISFRGKLLLYFATLVVLLQLFGPYRYAYRYESTVVATQEAVRRLTAPAAIVAAAGPAAVTIGESLEAADTSAAEVPLPGLHAHKIQVWSAAALSENEINSLLASRLNSNSSVTNAAKDRSHGYEKFAVSVWRHHLGRLDDPDATSGSIDETAQQPTDGPFRYASFTQNATEDRFDLATLRRHLSGLLEAAEGQLAKIEQFRTAAANGVLCSITRDWRLRLRVIDLDHVRLSIVLLASWLPVVCRAWLTRRPTPQRSVRRTHGQDVLRKLQIPVLASIGQPSVVATADSSGQTLTAPPKQAIDLSGRFIRGYDHVVFGTAKWILILTLAVTSTRLIFDGSWRQLCLERPLPALCRVVAF